MAVELATAYVSLVPSAKGMGAAIGKELGGPVEQAAGDAGKKAGGILSGTLGKAAAIGGGFFAAKFGTDFVKGTIDAASDLNETISKSNTIFGSSAAEINKWAGGAAKGLGQSRQQALDAAATFGNMFAQLGIGADQTAGMSKQMVNLASDFASFHNADINDVLIAQTAAFRGEYDAVQRFVPTINAAAVEQKALAMTHKATTKELSLQDKALATQALLMEGAGAATGDFARTSNGLANKQRILTAQMDNAKAVIGQALLPVVTKITSFFADKLPGAIESTRTAFRAVGDVVGTVFNAFKVLMGDDGPQGFGEIMDNLLGNSGKYVDLFRSIGEVIVKVASFIGDNFKPILIGLGVAFVLLTSPVTAVIAALVLLYVKFKPVRQVVAAVVDSLGDFAKFVKKLAPQVGEAFGHIARAAEVLWGMFGDNVLTAVKSVFRQFQNIIETVVRIVRDVIQVVVALINGDWGKAWAAFRDIPAAVIGFIVDTVKNLGPLLGAALGAIGETLVRGFEAAWGKVWDFAKKVPGLLLDALGDVGLWLVDTGKKILEGLWNGFVLYLEVLKAFYIDLPLKILEWLGDVGKWLVDTGKKILAGLWDGLVAAWNAGGNFFRDLLGKVLGVLGDVGRWLFDTGGKIIRGLYDGLKWLWDREIRGLLNIKSWILGLFDKAGDWLYGMGKKLTDGLIRGIKAAPGAIKDALTSLIPHKLHVPGTNLDLNIPGFADGGIVPGPVGQPQLAVVHGGELVLNRSQQAALPVGAGAPLIGGNVILTVDNDDPVGTLTRNLRGLRYQMTGAW